LRPDDLRIGQEPFDGPVARALVSALDADLDERYAADDDDLGGEPDHQHLKVLTESVAPPLGAFLVARLDGEPVACGALRPYDAPGRTAELKRMYVVPSARGKGIARRLLSALEAEAVNLGYVRIVLETGLRQQEAIALYESTGYEPIPSFGAFRHSPLSRCYAKALPG
jgi:GNAT superfamily N-acetyltransferase